LSSPPALSSVAIKRAAEAVGFTLVGLAPAEPLDPAPLRRWLASGYAAQLAMGADINRRLDPTAVLPGARTVLVLGIPYGSPASRAAPSAIADYARGRDYHYTHRDRMRLLRHRLMALAPGLHSYACVDAGAAMEKAWAERAGLGFIGKNGLVINRSFGSRFTLSLMVINCPVDSYDEPHPRLCGPCQSCQAVCPTAALPLPGVVDARRCLAYHTVENHGHIPSAIAARLGPRVFGCDACQAVCPFNSVLPAGDPRQAPRPLGLMDALAIAALTPAEFAVLVAGTPMRRMGYHGLRRNACLSLGSTRAPGARAVVERLALDPSPLVSEAARWSLPRL
jgi:epoxyqueuosine reductase